MSEKNFYDHFHKGAKPQHRLISEKNFTYTIILRNLKKIINKRNSLNILDYGCGVGTISLYLANKGHKVTGLDVSPLAIQTANESSATSNLSKHAKFYEINKGKIKIKKDKFDLILCTEVLEHVVNDGSVIKFFSSHLKRHGMILISVPSSNAPLYKMGLLGHFDKKVGHLRRYSLEEIRKLTESSGLTVTQTEKTEGIFRNIVFTMKPFTLIVRFLRWPISHLFMFVDSLSVPLFGESDIFIFAQKV